MTAHSRDLPVHAPIASGRLDSGFARQVLGKREARRLSILFDEAERLARQRMAAASAEVEEIFAHARAEARAILSMLPDFAALEAERGGKRNALSIIRAVADRAGLPVAAVTGHRSMPNTLPARNEAIRALAAAGFEPERIARLFFGGSVGVVTAIVERGGR